MDLLDQDCLAEGIPHEWFTYLRDNAPIYHQSESTFRREGLRVLRRHDAADGARLAHLG